MPGRYNLGLKRIHVLQRPDRNYIPNFCLVFESSFLIKLLFDENPDVIINIVDSTSLERSLYLTTQLLELDAKVIVALNMADILEQKGLIINEKN